MPYRYDIACAAIEVSKAITALWGSRTGVILVERYYHPQRPRDGWMTAPELAEREGNISPDTARRRLERMVDQGRAEGRARGAPP